MKQRLRRKNQLYISRKKSSLRAYSYKIGASALHPCGRCPQSGVVRRGGQGLARKGLRRCAAQAFRGRDERIKDNFHNSIKQRRPLRRKCTNPITITFFLKKKSNRILAFSSTEALYRHAAQGVSGTERKHIKSSSIFFIEQKNKSNKAYAFSPIRAKPRGGANRREKNKRAFVPRGTSHSGGVRLPVKTQKNSAARRLCRRAAPIPADGYRLRAVFLPKSLTYAYPAAASIREMRMP